MTEPQSTAPAAAHHPGFTPSNPPRSHWLAKTLIALVLLVFLVIVVRTIEKPKVKPPAAPVIPVGLAAARVGTLDVYLDAIGTVTPVYTDTIVSRVAGMITEVHFKEGQIVKKNDLLAIIDPRPYVAVLEQAQGQLGRDQATLKNARIELVRYQNSFKVHAIPEQQLATQQATVDSDEATVKLDEGNLAAAQVNVDYTRITAPSAGRVGLRNIDPGNVVTANGTSGLCVITQIQPITVIFTIAEDEIDEVTAEMASGRSLKVLALDRSKTHQLDAGTLLTVDNQVNTTTGTVRGRAVFANATNLLFPNQFVNTRLLVNTLKAATLIPTAAIQHNGQAAYVYVLLNNVAHLKPIKVGVTDGDTSQVTGINPGDVLATSNFDKLQEGAAVSLAGSSGRGARAGSSGSSAP